MTVDSWSPTPAELGFDWTLARAGDALTITWTVQNHASDTAWVADKLVQTSSGKATLVDRPVVRQSGRPHTALIAIGLVPPDVPLMHLPAPTYRSVAAGETLTGQVTVALPLVAWHPAARVDPLDGPTSVIFALDGFLGEPTSWRTLTGASGVAFQTPVYKTRYWLWSGAKALPAGG